MKLTCIIFSVTEKAEIPYNYPQEIKTLKRIYENWINSKSQRK